MASRPGADPLTAGEVVARLLERPAWQKDAACRGVGSGVFFVARGGDLRPAKALCAACPVTSACTDYAADTEAEGGIWGGVSAAQARRAHPLAS